MKILFIGNFTIDYCTEVHHKKTLEKLGHEVITVQENTATKEEILEKLDGISLLMHTHTHSWHIQGIEEVYQACKEARIPTVGYHLDLWFGIERERDLETDPYWRIQYFFSVDKKMVDYLNSHENMPKAFFLPAGVFEDECHLGTPREEYKHDIIFVGSKGYHPEWQYRPQLIEWLQKTYGKRFAHYGGDGRGVVRGERLNDLYASAKVVIGDTLCKNFDYPYYLSDRVFETTGRGGFIIHPYIKGLEDLFELHESFDSRNHPQNIRSVELITYNFGDFNQLSDLINTFVENDELRNEIRMNGFERTKKDHTYTNRLSEMLRIVTIEKDLKNIG